MGADNKLPKQFDKELNSDNFEQHLKVFCSITTSPAFMDKLDEFVATMNPNDPNFCVVDVDSNV